MDAKQLKDEQRRLMELFFRGTVCFTLTANRRARGRIASASRAFQVTEREGKFIAAATAVNGGTCGGYGRIYEQYETEAEAREAGEKFIKL